MSKDTPAGLHQSLKMANDIARNMGAGRTEDEACEAVASHIKKFWPPVMINTLAEGLEQLDDQLLPIAKKAIQSLTSNS
ncbi:MAG: formate dehydrogenase subunit delta [Pseudomonadales bacterium]